MRREDLYLTPRNYLGLRSTKTKAFADGSSADALLRVGMRRRGYRGHTPTEVGEPAWASSRPAVGAAYLELTATCSYST